MGGLNKLGAGTLLLAANETYTGNTTITAGTLVFSGGISSTGISLIDVQSGSLIFSLTNVNKKTLHVETGSAGLFEVASGTHTIGSITGNGITQIDAGTILKATCINQHSLVIGSGAKVILGGASLATADMAVESVPEPTTCLMLVCVLFTACVTRWHSKGHSGRK
jgi:autotransporter-associated beta strand protein